MVLCPARCTISGACLRRGPGLTNACVRPGAPEDIEQAVIRCESALEGHPEFAHYTEQLSNMMQHLIGAAQPRVQKAWAAHLWPVLSAGGCQRTRKTQPTVPTVDRHIPRAPRCHMVDITRLLACGSIGQEGAPRLTRARIALN